MVSWVIEKTVVSAALMVLRKGQCFFHYSHFLLSKTTLITLFLCRQRKPRKNTTKGWFPKEPLDVGASPPTDVAADVGDLTPMDVGASAPMDIFASAHMDVAISAPLVVAAYSPPRVHKVSIHKKLTQKKRTQE
jgi:hypothetical protein